MQRLERGRCRNKESKESSVPPSAIHFKISIPKREEGSRVGSNCPPSAIAKTQKEGKSKRIK